MKRRKIEVVNLGGRGKAAAGVLQDTERIARTPPEPGTAVSLLYIGNNEFLRFDRRHDLRKAERDLVDEPVLQEREALLRRYESTRERIIQNLRRAGVPVVTSTVVVNMKDWEPNRSVLADPAHKPRVRALWADGERKLGAGDAAGALQSYLGILALEPRFAIACMRAGDCYRRIGQIDQARSEYQRAVDEDGNPLRESSQQDSVRREVCERNHVPLVDAVGILEAASQDHLLGYDLVWHNCHPTLDGYRFIAAGFVEKLEPLLGVHRTREKVEIGDVERALGVDSTFVRGVFHSRGQYCYTASTLTWNPTPRLERARYYVERAARMGPEDADITCSQGVLAGLAGDIPRRCGASDAPSSSTPSSRSSASRTPHVVQLMQRNGIQDRTTRLK